MTQNYDERGLKALPEIAEESNRHHTNTLMDNDDQSSQVAGSFAQNLDESLSMGSANIHEKKKDNRAKSHVYRVPQSTKAMSIGRPLSLRKRPMGDASIKSRPTSNARRTIQSQCKHEFHTRVF
jgi:hypothetical protein